MSVMEGSPIDAALAALSRDRDTSRIQSGPPEGDGWIRGAELGDATSPPFLDLVTRIGERAGTRDKRTIAASLALRLGFTSILPIASYLRHRCVPDASLDNLAFAFRPSTFLDRMALLQPAGVVTAGDPRGSHRLLRQVADDRALLAALRHVLDAQARPLVESLYAWSGFSRRGTWGLLTSAWAAQFTALCPTPHDHRQMSPIVDGLFAGDDLIARMRPQLHEVSDGGSVHLYQRRSSCCRYYLLPQGDLCASCPLVKHDERMTRNRQWMREQRDRTTPGAGHG